MEAEAGRRGLRVGFAQAGVPELRGWLAGAGPADARVETSGALAYFTAAKPG